MASPLFCKANEITTSRTNAAIAGWMVVFVLLSGSLSSCSIWEADDWNWNRGGFQNEDIPERINGPRPLYARADAYDIYSDVPRLPINLTSVFQEGNLLFTVDGGLGVHVEDNTNRNAPVRLSFIVIPGVNTASADGDRLYANNFVDLVTIDISDLDNVRVVSRQADFYEAPVAFPPNHDGFFECYDANKGPLLGWENASLVRPQCRIN